ncbi:MAG: xanthine dehydrogenase family protein molybdopterin-binding subunit [Chloroflexi bacterium]|nr:xanthine dehydrogenase family protein molybdopterin-binding subunit [Chloroflexota bacterium]
MAAPEREHLSVVGQRVPRLDALDKATGRVTYGVDFQLPHMLHAKMLRSPYAHARIQRVDTARARAIPGVKAVLTGRDVPQRQIGFILKDQDVLARDRVRYIGEPVALVAAVDEATAERALDAIEAEYEELPAVFNVEDALGQDAPLLHDEHTVLQPGPMSAHFTIRPVPGTNICNYLTVTKGNADEAFAQADLVLEDTYHTHVVQHCHLEPHAMAARCAPSGDITVWTNAQRIFGVRTYLSDVFGLPISRFRVIGTEVGGGFGGKVRPNFERYVVLLAQRTGKPVKLVLTREEEFTTAYRSVPGLITVKTGVQRDGKIVARAVTVKWDTGAYAEGGPPVLAALNCGVGPYDIPNVKIESMMVYTNKVPGTSYRGVGVPELTFATESQMDVIAKRLGMDPVEFRLKNILKDGDTTVSGAVLRSVGLRECLEKVRDAIGWGQAVAPNRARAVVCFHKFPHPSTSSCACVMLAEDGTVTLLTGATEIGQGARTVLAQICAEELGVKLEAVTVTMADTGATPFDHGTFSSRVTYHTGNAVRLAAQDARRQVLDRASRELRVPANDLTIEDGKVFAKGAPEINVPLSGLARASHTSSPGPVQGTGSYYGGQVMESVLAGQVGQEETSWKFGATGIEIQVDQETGQFQVTKLVSAHDCGYAINPMNVEGQIEGAAVMGLANVTLEEVLFDGGKVVNPNFMDYRIPTAADCPDVTPIIVEEPTPTGPFGAKGVGELANIGMGAAMANALDNLVGIRVTSTPISAEKVLRALRDKVRGSRATGI